MENKQEIGIVKNLAIILPNKIKYYKKIISEHLPGQKIIYCESYDHASTIIKSHPDNIYRITCPDYFWDTPLRANNLAQLAKSINPKNKTFCYAKRQPLDSLYIDLLITFSVPRTEINVILDLVSMN